MLLTTVMKIHQVPKRILEVSVWGRRGEPWGGGRRERGEEGEGHYGEW